MSDKTYDLIKRTALVIAPFLVLAVLIVGLIKGMDVQELVTILVAIEGGIGTLVEVLSARYRAKEVSE